MLLEIVVFKIDGNYYSKFTFIMTNKTREICVHIGYFIHSGVFMCFLPVPGYPKISNFEYPVPEITKKRTALLSSRLTMLVEHVCL